MCNCKWFNGDSCDYPDYTNGKNEDGYCSFELEHNPDNIECDEYIEADDEDSEADENDEER